MRNIKLKLFFYYLSKVGKSGDIYFDDDEVWTIGSATGKSLLWVATHEIGHAIGLSHSNIKEAVMFPYYKYTGGKDFKLHADDKLGAQTAYGKFVCFVMFATF